LIVLEGNKYFQDAPAYWRSWHSQERFISEEPLKNPFLTKQHFDH